MESLSLSGAARTNHRAKGLAVGRRSNAREAASADAAPRRALRARLATLRAQSWERSTSATRLMTSSQTTYMGTATMKTLRKLAPFTIHYGQFLLIHFHHRPPNFLGNTHLNHSRQLPLCMCAATRPPTASSATTLIPLNQMTVRWKVTACWNCKGLCQVTACW